MKQKLIKLAQSLCPLCMALAVFAYNRCYSLVLFGEPKAPNLSDDCSTIHHS